MCLGIANYDLLLQILAPQRMFKMDASRGGVGKVVARDLDIEPRDGISFSRFYEYG